MTENEILHMWTQDQGEFNIQIENISQDLIFNVKFLFFWFLYFVIGYFRGKVKPSQLIENLINYRNEDKERCNMLLLMLVVS